MLDQYLSEQEHCLTENFVLLRKSIVPAKYDKPVFYLGEKNLLIFFLGGGNFFFSPKGFLLKMTHSNRLCHRIIKPWACMCLYEL